MSFRQGQGGNENGTLGMLKLRRLFLMILDAFLKVRDEGLDKKLEIAWHSKSSQTGFVPRIRWNWNLLGVLYSWIQV